MDSGAGFCGFAKVERSVLSKDWSREPKAFALYMHLALMANWQREEWHGLTINPGQLFTSIKSLSNCTGLSEQEIRTALKHLEKAGAIKQDVKPGQQGKQQGNQQEKPGYLAKRLTRQKTPPGRLITIVQEQFAQTANKAANKAIQENQQAIQQGSQQQIKIYKDF